MLKGLSVIMCQVSDMDRAVAFYRDVLGLKPGNVSPYWSDFEAGGAKIGLHPPLKGSEAPYSISGKGWIIGFATDDLAALKARLLESGAEIRDSYHDIPGGVILDFADPDGNALRAAQYGISAKDLA